MFTINSRNQIYIDGVQTKLAVLEYEQNTLVYWFKSTKPVEMPYRYYSLVHMGDMWGIPGLITLEEHVRAVLNAPKVSRKLLCVDFVHLTA